MNKYLVIIEKTNTGYSAYSPDLLGCVSTGATTEEVQKKVSQKPPFPKNSMILYRERKILPIILLV